MTISNKARLIISAVLILIGIGINFLYLAADAPLYFTGAGQSLTTDPPQYTYFARNDVNFNDPPVLDKDRWISFKHSVVNRSAGILFSILGPSRQTANLTGITLLLLAYLFVSVSLRKYLKLESLIIIPLILLFVKPMFVFGRLPYLENGMIFFIALMLVLFFKYRQFTIGQVLIGILIGLTAVSGKIFGLIMIVPVALTIIFENNGRGLKSVGVISISSLAVVLLWPLLFYASALDSVLTYYAVQSTGLYGFPEALKSPITFIERFISFGNDSRFYYHAIILGILSFLSLFYLILRVSVDELRKNIPLAFSIFWLAIGVIFFMISNYRPLRYIYFLYIPMSIMVVYVFYGKLAPGKIKLSYGRLALLSLLLWIFVEQIMFVVLSDGQFERTHAAFVWYSLPIGLVLALLIWKSNISYKLKLNKSIVVVLPFLLIAEFGVSYWGWHSERAYNLSEAGADLGEILNDGALIAGPIAPALLYENYLQGMIYASGISDLDRAYFRKHPITHLIVDPVSSGGIIKKYPELENAVISSEYWIRDKKYQLVRINHLTGNQSARLYKPTDFEIGREYFQNRSLDSALFYLERFRMKNPDNKSTLRLMGDLLPMLGKFDQGLASLKKGSEIYPDDYTFYLRLGTLLLQRYQVSREPKFLDISNNNFSIAIEKNKYLSDEITSIKKNLSIR